MTMPKIAQANERVAYLIKMFPRFSETFILSEVLELERTGVDLRIYSLKTPVDPRRHADVDRVQAPVTYVPEDRLRAAGDYLRRHATIARRHPWRYLKTLGQVARRHNRGAVKRFLQAGYIAPELEDARIGHIHAHFASSATSVAHFINQLAGIGYSFTAHAKDIYIDTVSPDVLVRKMSKARFVVTVSDYNERHLRALDPVVPIHRVYNGLDLTSFHPNGTLPDTTPLILAVGRLVEKKGFADLVRACGRLRDAGLDYRCMIVGTGAEQSRLRHLIDDLDLHDRIELAGAMPREELVTLYPRASVFVAPCIVGADGNRDGLPTVLIEAMALGVPVISTPVTGIPELVRHEETGLLVSPNAPDELALAIDRSLSHRSWALAMARQGRLLVEEQFDLRHNVARLHEFFTKASRTTCESPRSAPISGSPFTATRERRSTSVS